MSDTSWRTVDFRPACAGWRVIHLGHDAPSRTWTDAWSARPLAGWLIREDDNGDRQVVAADVDEDGEVLRVRVGLPNVSAWYIAGPGDPDPTPDEIRAELDARAVDGRPA